MTDRFDKHASSLESPATGAFVITPDDNTDLPETTRAIYVGTAGDLDLRMLDGQDIIFSGIPAGMILPVRATRVRLTATTATDIIGLV